MIKEIPINDNWLYRDGFTQDCLEREFDWSDSYIVQLPHNIDCTDAQYFDERNMRRLTTYSRILTVPSTYNGKRLLLRLEGVLSYVEIYVNGIFVTSHKGEASFVADITAPVKYDYENRIVLKVDSRLRKEVPCSGVRGPLTLFGGICRDVIFMICDGRDIRDVCVRTAPSGEGRTVTADIELFDYYPDTELEGEILDAAGTRVCVLGKKSVQASSVRLKGEVSDVTCWEPDNPVLYTAVIRLCSGHRVLDCRKAEFGFVSAVFRREGFFLNGKQVQLIGLNRADCYPVIGRSATGETERRDARILKQSGINAVRTMGVASKDFIDECNRIGLMVIEDVYGDGYIGSADWRDAFLAGITDMILRDRNNPSIIGWGIRSNNSADCDELYFKAHKAAKEADPTRATVGARSFTASHVYEDVFACNETGQNIKKRRSKRFMPYLIGEHGGAGCPARTYDDESVRLHQALCHAYAISDVRRGAVLGAFGMSYCDFATGRGKGSGDNLGHYGIFDAYRNPKLAAYVYKSQRDEEPVMKLSSNLSADDYTGALYVFTNADGIVLYRNDEKVGEFAPDTKHWPYLKHPPIVIDDFCGDLPAKDVGEGIRLRLFKNVLRLAEKRNLHDLGFWGSKQAFLLRKLCKLDTHAFLELLEKYMRNPPDGVTYRFEAVYGGEVKATRTLSPDIRRTLRVESSVDKVLHCGKSFERIAFTLTAEDGRGNLLDYSFMPVSVRASGSLSVEGNGHISLEGGRGGFFVRSISPGPGRVTVTSETGVQSFDYFCEYADGERF